MHVIPFDEGGHFAHSIALAHVQAVWSQSATWRLKSLIDQFFDGTEMSDLQLLFTIRSW